MKWGTYIIIISNGFDMVLMKILLLHHCQWEFQDPKVEVLYHIRPYVVGIFPYISLI